ncbi:uncharacterized protein LOC116351683 [Contarinia nasturtii]|uniref:uncharacterized protein LOC116351683 n=1 Tax=Contarinia nasturtii TaxID=265458 RepID=UPI0012D470F8|nr:uncharacterized protein LOC116351683 [Contarinia nasturtii]
MASTILDVKDPIVQDEDIISKQFHTYTPYTTSYNNNDEVRIVIQSQDLIVLPSESYLMVEYSTRRNDDLPFANNEAMSIYNCLAHLFSELRYELNGVEIDRCKLPGITSTLKCMIACKEEDGKAYHLFNQYANRAIIVETNRVLLPLRFLFGFADDFRRIILNSKHELILVRSRSNVNFYQAATDILRLNVTKIHWKIPHVVLSDRAKLGMLKVLSNNESLQLPFRSWDLYELPVVPQTTRHTWSVKTTSQVCKPRYVIVCFQTNRNNVITNDASRFDHCNITNMRLYLNNERYPYDDMNLNFTATHCHELYHMFSNIQYQYYSNTTPYNPLGIDLAGFMIRPVFAFDCSRSDESVKGGMVDVRIEIEASENIPNNTSAYCLIIHDNLVQYSPFTGLVHRII